MPVVLKLCLTILICFINSLYTNCLTIILCASFIRVTDCSNRISRSFTRGLQPPCPTPILLWLFQQSDRMPHLRLYLLKEDTSLPAMFNLLLSSTNQPLFKRNFCDQSSHYGRIMLQMEAITCNWHFSWAKINGTQRRAVVSPWRMHCMHSGMAKGTSRAEATLNSEKIKSHCWVTPVWRNQAGS